jgi:uncharacterized repeat protein (TIGR01451 family)
MSIPAGDAEAATWNIGDVFVGTDFGTHMIFSNSGVYKETIDHGYGGQNTGCAFNPSLDKFYATNFANTRVVVYEDAHPHAIADIIDAGAISPGGRTESIVFAANGDFYIGHPDGNQDIHRYNAAGEFQQSYDVAIENRGSDWIDLAADQKTMFYTSEGREIKRYDVSGGGVQLPDFATVPWPTVYALRLLPPGDGSGGLIVANTLDIRRLDGSGAVVQIYDAPGEDRWFAMNLDPNGTSFWSGGLGGTGNLYRFNIATGAVEVGPIFIGAGMNVEGICVKGELTAGIINALEFSKDDDVPDEECKAKGENILYDLCFDNIEGTEDIYNVLVTDSLPLEVDFVLASDGGVYDPGTHTVTWDIGKVLAGAPRRCLQLEVTVLSSPTLKVTNYATIEGGVPPDNVKTTVTEQTDVCGLALVAPLNGRTNYLPPGLLWKGNLGPRAVYVVDFLLPPSGSIISIPPRQDTEWRVPDSTWSKIPRGSKIYWRVRGLDPDAMPPVVFTTETWRFYKY